MCTGFNSPGTISEVIRGYLGDVNARNIFANNEKIYINKFFSFKSGIFDLVGNSSSLRPMELATLRLQNMVEILSKWNIYMTDQHYLTQRSGTFLADRNGSLLYSYKSQAL